MTPHDRRAVLTGVAAIAVAVVAFRLAPMAGAHLQTARENLEARAELLTRMRTDLRDTARLQDSAEVVRRRMAGLAGRLLSPDSQAEAATALGALVSMAAERHRVRVSRTEAIADSAYAGLARRVSLRATLESDTAGLLGMLRVLAGGPAVLMVGDLRVAADAPATPAAPELLHTEITVRGWYLPRVSTP
jgi:Type II secretion system (T2SS), protein M subtype b